MYNKIYINDAEYERLSWHEQGNYYWCEHCGLFYNKKILPHGCAHGMQEGQ